MMEAIFDDYAGMLSARIASERLSLARRWLDRLKQLLTVEPAEVFPSQQLIDHIPALIGEIAAYLQAPAEGEIAANTAVIEKARELGALRHEQRASVHQLLHEYETLIDILEAFVDEETARLGLQPSPQECFDVLRRLRHATATLMRTTVDTFISRYTTTIQEQSERITTFNRAASHELRSPIGTILFAAGLLEKDRARLAQDEERLGRIAATIRVNGERLMWLIQNLQRLARLSEPLDVPSQQRTDVHMIALEVVRQLEDVAAVRHVNVRVIPGLPTITLDPARLELVLLNLVSNAIKYSDPHKNDCFVEIAPGPANDDASRCTIAVRDNGLGIPEGDQAAVFERFFRAHAYLDQELGVTGSGLGLAIVADCVNDLGGSIRFESTPGTGTTFYITLPCGEGANV